MSSRLPLSTLPLSQFIPTSSTTSPSKRSTPLRQSALSMSLLPSPFLASTTPRTATTSGPLSTLYERTGARGGVGEGSPRSTRSRNPSSRLIDQEEQQEQLEGDETSVTTTPKRLLDLFVQSAEKGSPSKTSERASSARKEEVVEETAPAWDFYFDDNADATSLPPSPEAEVSTIDGLEEEEEAMESVPFKENVQLPPRRFRSSTANETASAPPSLPGSINPSPARPPSPPRLSLPSPSTVPTSSNSNRVETPPKTPDAFPHSPTYPTSYPPLNVNPEVELGGLDGFSEGGIGSFEKHSEAETLNGLGFGLESELYEGGMHGHRKGKKRLSDEMSEERGADRGKEKRLKPEDTQSQ
ncbi:uncharacterized protein JCM6883_004084 [Sporobolomyces salmoneus]|uniref:uncharacterized protein n=1 Tax=Sporobolomyces salmoneus TaxID=183962 RepID=UPI00317FCB1D